MRSTNFFKILNKFSYIKISLCFHFYIKIFNYQILVNHFHLNFVFFFHPNSKMLYTHLSICLNSIRSQTSASTRKLSLSTTNRLLKSNRISTFHQPYNYMSQKTTTTPKVLYLQSPFIWLRNKFHMKVLKLALDPQFNENDFKRGVKQV